MPAHTQAERVPQPPAALQALSHASLSGCLGAERGRAWSLGPGGFAKGWRRGASEPGKATASALVSNETFFGLYGEAQRSGRGGASWRSPTELSRTRCGVREFSSLAQTQGWVEAMRRLIVLLLVLYKRFLSPLLPPACRFEPSCSVYMMGAVERFGALRGTVLGLRRLSRCHPFHPGGHDPVPELGETEGRQGS